MLNRITKISIVMSAVAVLAGCTGSGDDDPTPTDMQAVYIGDWSTGCIANPLISQPNEFAVFEMKIGDTQWESVMSFYLDEACTVQTDGSLEAGDLRTRGTITILALYTDKGTVITSDGIEAHTLTSMITETSSSLEDQANEPAAMGEDEAIVGGEFNALVYVDDANLLYTGNIVVDTIGETAEGNTLLLTLPYNKSE